MRPLVFSLLLVAAAFARLNAPARSAAPRPVADDPFQTRVKPLLSKYCFECHNATKKKGNLVLDAFADEAAATQKPQIWAKVFEKLQAKEMPPEDHKQPAAGEVAPVLSWIDAHLSGTNGGRRDPGRVTIRRLNRVEYNNTIRDLVGVDFHPADDFPQDDLGYGFDNIGDVLTLPPILMEQYLKAAQRIAETAIVIDDPAKRAPTKFGPDRLRGGQPHNNNARMLTSQQGEIGTKFKFPKDGEYVLRVRAFGQQAGPDKARMAFRIDDKDIEEVDVPATEDAPKDYEVNAKVEAGDRRVAVRFTNDYYKPDDPDPKNRDRNLVVEEIEIVAPAGAVEPIALPDSHNRIIFVQPTGDADKLDCARKILEAFVSRAYRRPVTPEEVNRLVRFVKLAESNGDKFESGIRLAVQAALVSPHFLFRVELDDRAISAEPLPISEWQLASRLSYFLWSSMPDAELLAQAKAGTLRKNLEGQVRRMLADPRSQAFVENFAGQWLQTRNLKLMTPDPKRFPSFDEPLRAAMARETELFFETMLREDRSVLDFLDADFTFLNERLAKHYGIDGVSGDEFRRVSLAGTPRGGVLTQASILTLTSNPTRTSPVKRGKWILENILGTPPPPPPGDVPELKDDKPGEPLTGTLRQRMEQHRADPTCAICHQRMDPLGFGFENFDAVGAWRTQDGDAAIDPSGTLPGGQSFKSPAELRAILKTKSELFARCLAEKMLTYAIGRGTEYYDKAAIDQITGAAAKDGYKFSRFVLEVVRSEPFQLRRGTTN